MEKWRLEHPHDTPPYPLMPSPTFAHSSIAAALPSTFGSLLSGTSLLSSLSGAATIATAAGGEAARTAAHSVSNAGRQVTNPTASGLFNWRYWLILAAAIAAVLIFLLAR